MSAAKKTRRTPEYFERNWIVRWILSFGKVASAVTAILGLAGLIALGFWTGVLGHHKNGPLAEPSG